jgi:hypothetical protein
MRNMRKTLKGNRRALATAAIAAVATIAACNGLRDDLLEAPDPDVIDPSSVQSAAGAASVRLGALARLRLATVGSGNAGTEGTWLLGGLLVDEWSTSSTFVQNDEVDERQTSLSNSSVEGSLRAIYRVRTAANQAVGLLNKFKPTPASDIAEMYFARGFAELQLGSDFCNGIPLSDATADNITFGQPLTVAEIFNIAVASLDSAINMTTATDNASVAINRAARIAKARALLGLNRPADAATAVAGVPTSYTYDATSSATSQNGIWNQGLSQRRYTIGDSLEGNDHKLLVKNAIPFFSVHDARLPATYTISGKDTTKSQDGLIFSRTTTLYNQTTSISIVNGIDARLAEAEAALRANDPATMLSILNALRAAPQTLGTLTTSPAALPPLTDPGTADGRVNLLFREKAFWTFARGQRLGDLRRLVRQYNRTPDQVFPIGTHYRGTSYGADVNLPITTGESNGNPDFTACKDRNA